MFRLGRAPRVAFAGSACDAYDVAIRKGVGRTVDDPIRWRKRAQNFDLGSEIAPERDAPMRIVLTR